MSWSFRIARIMGTDVKVHVTFLLLLAFQAFNGFGTGGQTGALFEVALTLSIFTCVLLHEFGHILMARRFGIRTPDVILLPIGGLARLERLPEKPRQEFWIALAGPAVTLAIALGLFAWLSLTGPLPWPLEDANGARQFLMLLTVINGFLLGFNLIPAYPMDGGRVLRAVLASRMGMVEATRLAARIGRTIAMAGGAWALFGPQPQPMLVLIAIFIFFAAGQEASLVETRAAGRGIIVDQMMITRFVTIPVYGTLRQAVDLLLEGEQSEFPVVDNAGALEGLLTRDLLIRSLTDHGPDAPVSQAMARTVPKLPLGLGFDEALGRLRASGLPALPVVDATGRLAGLLTLDNITDLIMVRQAVAK
jgi:Zn-dependent protease/CBS domain-containing protein